MRGTFYAIEGIDGAGKSSAALELVRWMNAQGDMPTLHTYEPYPSFITETLYDVLYGEIPEAAPPLMATLFAAARLHHTMAVLEPALTDGLNIVCDRYVFSTFAYNASPAVTRSDIELLHQSFYLAPAHVFYLHCDPDFAFRRLATRAARQSIYETNLGKLRQAAAAYEAMFAGTTITVCGKVSMVHRIDAMQPLSDVMETMTTAIARSAVPSSRKPVC